MLNKISLTTFDPADKAHREAVSIFLKQKSWANSPYRFSHKPPFGSVADQVKAELLEWYVAREMNSVTKVNLKWKDERLIGCKCPTEKRNNPRCHIHSAS